MCVCVCLVEGLLLQTPCVVTAVEGVVVGVAAARNHTVILTKR